MRTSMTINSRASMRHVSTLPNRKRRLRTWLLMTYFVLVPFTYVLAPSPLLPIPLFFLVGVLLLVPPVWRFPLGIRPVDMLLPLMAISGTVAAFWAPSAKSLTHVTAILVCTGIYFFFVRAIAFTATPRMIGHAATASLLAVSLFVIAESLALNLLGINIHDLLPSPDINANSKWTIAGTWHRARGLSEEPAHSALFFALALPVSLLSTRTKLGNILFYSLTCSAYILLFSTASMLALLAGTVVAAMVSFVRSPKLLVTVCGTVALAGIMYASVPTVNKYINHSIVLKVSGLLGEADPVSSSNDRRQRATLFVDLGPQFAWGRGWGTLSHFNQEQKALFGKEVPASFLSLYADVYAASGAIGLVALLVFIGERLVRLALSRRRAALPVLVAVVALCIHYSVIGNYWYPFIWLALALADSILYRTSLPGDAL